MSHKKLFACLAVLWMSGIFVALFAPLDVLTGSELLGGLCGFLFSLIDMCDLILMKSSFPEVSVVYFFIIWLSFPFWFLVLWRWMLRQVGGRGGGLIFKENLSPANKVALIFISPIWVFLLYVVVVLYDGGDSRLFKLGSSRIQLGFWGMVVPASTAALCSLVIFTMKRVFQRVDKNAKN